MHTVLSCNIEVKQEVACLWEIPTIVKVISLNHSSLMDSGSSLYNNNCRYSWLVVSFLYPSCYCASTLFHTTVFITLCTRHSIFFKYMYLVWKLYFLCLSEIIIRTCIQVNDCSCQLENLWNTIWRSTLENITKVSNHYLVDIAMYYIWIMKN